MRTGLIAKKLGMSRLFRDSGEHVPVTVLQLDACQVVGQKTRSQHGYDALQIGAGTLPAHRATRPQRVLFDKRGLPPKVLVAEFRVSEANMIGVGATLSADHMVEGQWVDATGVSKGKGFAGAMKRHKFHGLRATHGVSVSHRSHGSTGQCQDPGRVFKGKKMAGHMGDRQVSTQNLRVEKVDVARGVIFVRGSIAGSRGQWVLLRDAVKRPLPENAPLPGKIVPNAGDVAEEARG